MFRIRKSWSSRHSTCKDEGTGSSIILSKRCCDIVMWVRESGIWLPSTSNREPRYLKRHRKVHGLLSKTITSTFEIYEFLYFTHDNLILGERHRLVSNALSGDVLYSNTLSLNGVTEIHTTRFGGTSSFCHTFFKNSKSRFLITCDFWHMVHSCRNGMSSALVLFEIVNHIVKLFSSYLYFWVLVVCQGFELCSLSL